MAMPPEVEKLARQLHWSYGTTRRRADVQCILVPWRGITEDARAMYRQIAGKALEAAARVKIEDR